MRGVWFIFCLGWPMAGEIERAYRQAGLDDRQAAAHMLNRLTFGPRPGDIDRVVATGLDAWYQRQLQDPEPQKWLELDILRMSDEEILEKFPGPGVLISKMKGAGQDPIRMEEGERRLAIRKFAREKGYRPQRELVQTLVAQKLYRAVYAQGQLREVLTDFWFNHFNVSVTNNRARPHVLAYERDAIRPHVFGKFRDMLQATAKHPAMLLYLDNALSSVPEASPSLLEHRPFWSRLARKKRDGPLGGRRGINENYARELLELHTLGVDGGYTQMDIEELARVFTGWTVYPRQANRQKRFWLERMPGLIREGAFLFVPALHDAGPKTVLGHTLPARGGLEDGERALDLLAGHPSTARFIATKFARRFVGENPPPSLVDTLASTFQKTEGDLQALVDRLVTSAEFWDPETIGNKIKTPVFLAAGALRILDAEITEARPLARWIRDMGQPLYACEVPTGFPDEAAHWINAGALKTRMEFADRLVRNRIRGVTIHWEKLALENGYSTAAAIARTLLPERDVTDLVLLKTQPTMPVEETPSLARKLLESFDLWDAWQDGSDHSRQMAALVLASPHFQKQ